MGDIFTQKLTIIEGAEFNGKVEMKKMEMKKEENKVIELELKGAGSRETIKISQRRLASRTFCQSF